MTVNNSQYTVNTQSIHSQDAVTMQSACNQYTVNMLSMFTSPYARQVSPQQLLVVDLSFDLGEVAVERLLAQ